MGVPGHPTALGNGCRVPPGDKDKALRTGGAAGAAGLPWSRSRGFDTSVTQAHSGGCLLIYVPSRLTVGG